MLIWSCWVIFLSYFNSFWVVFCYPDAGLVIEALPAKTTIPGGKNVVCGKLLVHGIYIMASSIETYLKILEQMCFNKSFYIQWNNMLPNVHT